MESLLTASNGMGVSYGVHGSSKKSSALDKVLTASNGMSVSYGGGHPGDVKKAVVMDDLPKVSRGQPGSRLDFMAALTRHRATAQDRAIPPGLDWKELLGADPKPQKTTKPKKSARPTYDEIQTLLRQARKNVRTNSGAGRAKYAARDRLRKLGINW